jgi:precorrin-2 dehydrogenase/sirohydrochlorin ferrochelatase
VLEAGANHLSVYSSQFAEIKFSEFDFVLIVDAPNAESLHAQAKAAGCIVNVEDEKQFCDFYFQTFVQRGDLQISVSTNGKSPATARMIRECLEQCYPAEWEQRLEEIAAKRSEWKQAGASYAEVNDKTEEYVKSRNWLCKKGCE